MSACEPPMQYPALPEFIHARERIIAMADIFPISPVEKKLFSSGSEKRLPYSSPLIFDKLAEERKDGQVAQHVQPVVGQASGRVEHSEFAEGANGVGEIADRGRIPGLAKEKFGLKAIDIGVDGQTVAVLGFDPDKLFRIDEGQLFDVGDFLPLGMELAMGTGTDQPMEAGFKSVGAAAPAHGQAAGHVVHLQHFHLVATLERIDRGAEASDAAADDDDFFAIVDHGLEPPFHGPQARNCYRFSRRISRLDG